MKKSLVSDSFTGKFYQTSKEESIAIIPKLIQKLKKKEHSQIHFMRLAVSRQQNQNNIYIIFFVLLLVQESMFFSNPIS